MIQPPALFGHELAGDIVAMGPTRSPELQAGRPRGGRQFSPLRGMLFLPRGRKTFVRDLLFNNGAYAEYIRIPERIVRANMYHIPAHVSYQDAALVEPLACVLRGLEETGVRPGDTVAVIGLGPIGMMFVRLATTVYKARVIAIGRRQSATRPGGSAWARMRPC